jgi:hypothetical protein
VSGASGWLLAKDLLRLRVKESTPSDFEAFYPGAASLQAGSVWLVPEAGHMFPVEHPTRPAALLDTQLGA